MPTITMPAVPVLGVPYGAKESGNRADFKAESFDMLIETKGYQYAWTRATMCPCESVATQTKTADPNCPLCNGGGWIYFGGSVPQPQAQIGTLTEVQEKIVTATSAMVIRGIATSIQAEYRPWDKLGNWMAGTMQITVRAENMLGFYDKLVCLDAQIVYAELREMPSGNKLPTRYLITAINMVRSNTQVYQIGVDYYLEDGEIWFYEEHRPETGDRLTVHYLCHPTYLVTEHPHVARVTVTKFKAAVNKTPVGTPRALPNQAIIRYDFLPG
jgi:hypothetical protein